MFTLFTYAIFVNTFSYNEACLHQIEKFATSQMSATIGKLLLTSNGSQIKNVWFTFTIVVNYEILPAKILVCYASRMISSIVTIKSSITLSDIEEINEKAISKNVQTFLACIMNVVSIKEIKPSDY